MNYLFIMGPSGCGKTTLAKNLEAFQPTKFKRITQNTTRDPREGESLEEYHFITQEEYEKQSDKHQMIAQVKEEFYPAMYGTPKADFDKGKFNIVVASIEGFMDAWNKVARIRDNVFVLFINNVEPEAERKDRSWQNEEKYNRIVLNKLNEGRSKFNLVEIDHAYLKRIRNSKKLLNRFMLKNKIRRTNV